MNRRALAALGMLLIVTGCEVQSEFDIYLRDLRQIVDDDEVKRIPVNSRLSVEVPTRDECVSRKQAIAEVIDAYFADATNLTCTDVDSGMRNFLRFDASSPLYDYDTAEQQAESGGNGDSIIHFGARQNDNGIYVLTTFFNSAALDSLTRDLEATFDTAADLDLELSDVIYRIRNDSKPDVRVGVIPSYLDGDPVPNTQYSFELGYRKSTELRLADVYVDGLTAYGSSSDLWFWDEESAKDP